jgi:hypothetical protein
LEEDIGKLDHIHKTFVLQNNDGEEAHSFEVKFDTDGNFEGAREISPDGSQGAQEFTRKYEVPTGEVPNTGKEGTTVFRRLIMKDGKLAFGGKKIHKEQQEAPIEGSREVERVGYSQATTIIDASSHWSNNDGEVVHSYD